MKVKHGSVNKNYLGMLKPKDLIRAIVLILSNQFQFINCQKTLINDGWSL